jgi:hypothetical protein
MKSLLYGATAVFTIIAVTFSIWWAYVTATYNDQHKIIAFVLTASVVVCIILYCVIFAGLVKRANLLPQDSKIQHLVSKVQWMKPPIKILAPVNHAEVGPQRSVLGSVQSMGSIVQVLVYAVDKWHLQGSVAEVDGFAWKVEAVTFGNPQSGLGKDFKIIAIADGNISGGPFWSLPAAGVKSEVVNVRRRH